MLKEAITKIEEITKNPIVEHEGEKYIIRDDGFEQIRSEIDTVSQITLTSLDALVQMINSEALPKYPGKIFIEAVKYDTVECFLSPDENARQFRPMLYKVVATDTPGWKPDGEMGFTEAIIAARTRFQQTPDTEYLLKLLSQISNGAEMTRNDNGIVTNVVSKRGVALQESETIRPIIALRPYRTFQEVEQPVSDFNIRVSERGIRFIEADGGMWKLNARKTIVEYLKNNLVGKVYNERVIIML